MSFAINIEVLSFEDEADTTQEPIKEVIYKSNYTDVDGFNFSDRADKLLAKAKQELLEAECDEVGHDFEGESYCEHCGISWLEAHPAPDADDMIKAEKEMADCA